METSVDFGDSEEFVTFFSCLKDLEEAVKTKIDDNLVYYFRIAADDTETYITPQICDVQQRLAKLLTLENNIS